MSRADKSAPCIVHWDDHLFSFSQSQHQAVSLVPSCRGAPRWRHGAGDTLQFQFKCYQPHLLLCSLLFRIYTCWLVHWSAVTFSLPTIPLSKKPDVSWSMQSMMIAFDFVSDLCSMTIAWLLPCMCQGNPSWRMLNAFNSVCEGLWIVALEVSHSPQKERQWSHWAICFLFASPPASQHRSAIHLILQWPFKKCLYTDFVIQWNGDGGWGCLGEATRSQPWSQFLFLLTVIEELMWQSCHMFGIRLEKCFPFSAKGIQGQTLEPHILLKQWE